MSLVAERAFAPAKRALRERHCLPSHWSCTHKQWWSALRYGVVPSESKPQVDARPYQWHFQGKEIDLFAESQQPWQSHCWKARRESKDKKAAAGATKQGKFTKLDLTALVLSEGLRTKNDVMDYAQERGTAKMQEFVHSQQSKLRQYIEEAYEWGEARAAAQAEREGDWSLLCRTADERCCAGAACLYAAAAAWLFRANAHVLSRDALAASLRSVIMAGPSKTTRVPLLVGPTNTGKTTLILPFDLLFGHAQVFHKPALGSKFALRNIVRGKRFVMWDDYRPVQYGQDTVHVPTFLSLFTGMPFEVQVSQSFTDGNPDFAWQRGAVMTAKEEGLWTPYGRVTAEDVKHMQSRVEIFRCVQQVSGMKFTDSCAHCMCRWIVDGAAAFDAAGLRPPRNSPGAASSANLEEIAGQEIEGLAELIRSARLPTAWARGLQEELLELGVVNVVELRADDWRGLASWSDLRPFEQRRLLCALEQ